MATKDWNATQYLKFEDERTRPCHDLASRVPFRHPRKIVDLGCGPGNSTAVLASLFPESHLIALDSSADMIEKARTKLPDIQFTVTDLNSFTPSEPVDLYFSNAVLHWLSSADRVNTMTRLIGSQASGGVFAFQVPDNLDEPSHEAMRQTAANGPWAKTLGSLQGGRDTFQTPREVYDVLKPLCSNIDIWHTTYYHVLDNHQAIVEWLKSSGLKPFIDPLSPEERAAFLDAYLNRLKESYPSCNDGKVILRFPRFFMVAVRA